MPYRSEAQNRYIHMKANEGVAWAQKFVADAHGSKVPKINHVKEALRKRRKRHG